MHAQNDAERRVRPFRWLLARNSLLTSAANPQQQLELLQTRSAPDGKLWQDHTRAILSDGEVGTGLVPIVVAAKPYAPMWHTIMKLLKRSQP